MLGIEKDPKIIKIREENPLNKIRIPDCEVADIDRRIEQFYNPV